MEQSCAKIQGYNPMRWDCKTQGCFNIKKRPKIETFAECFPGKGNFGDVDGLAEINHQFLFLEWKPAPISLSIGQKILYERLSHNPSNTILLLAGNAETMALTHRAWYIKGEFEDWKPYTLVQSKNWIRKWVSFARQN